MLVKIERFSYSKDETEGVLILPNGIQFATIEQPWRPNPNGALGGTPSRSCIPDGTYKLTPHNSYSKGEVYIIDNSDLGVFQRPQHHEEGRGRNLCYIHIANWAFQLEGCIAPGLSRLSMVPGGEDHALPAVVSSGTAMDKLKETLGRKHDHILSITSTTGATD